MNATARQPVVYLPHGGGPWPFVELGMPADELAALRAYLEGLATLPKVAPKAVLMISAHWEEPVATVSTSAHPPMLYDYYGFPPAAYTLQWPAPGDPALAARVRELVEHAGFASAADADRGYDHGAFVPLKLMYPEADIPTVQLSLLTGLDPARHVALGKALAPLRDEGVFVVASGMSFHNLRQFYSPSPPRVQEARRFDDWLKHTTTQPRDTRDAGLVAWRQAPGAQAAHPREEHLLPLMVAAGAAGDDVGAVAWTGTLMHYPLTAVHFG
ncbi:MAG: dioxygenase [Alphaproteobacteria bacterium]|nr:dioxygenase [Alphaproteobacteria bacterium]